MGLILPSESMLPHIDPIKVRAAGERLEDEIESQSLFNYVSRMAVPNVQRAMQTSSRNQTGIDQTRVACALELYKIRHGEYPDQLSKLVPELLTEIPRDVVLGGELKYRKTEGGFVLYSLGWDADDDGGKDAGYGTEGDWVWGAIR